MRRNTVGGIIADGMTFAIQEREENHRTAYRLMIDALGDRAIDTALFDPAAEPFAGAVVRTTWEEMIRAGYVESVGTARYRLTAKGWLAAIEVSGLGQAGESARRLGRLFAAMKAHVKGRAESAIVGLMDLAEEAGEPVGWVFNVIDSRGTTTSKRTGAGWYENERGRLVEIPVGFNMQPVDIAAALTVGHLEKIEELEARLEEAEEDRAQYHCPYCDAPVSSMFVQDYPEYHCDAMYHRFQCGFMTEDGREYSPCPYGPKWPTIDEFDFDVEQVGSLWTGVVIPKTDRAKKVFYSRILRYPAFTKEEAIEMARRAAVPGLKGRPTWD